MSTLEELKIRIVSVLGSEKNGCTEGDLCRVYKNLYGKDLRPREHGYPNLKTLLNSPAMQGKGGITCRSGRYFAAADENTVKMLELVRNTKSRKRSRTVKNIPAPRGRVRAVHAASSSGLGPSSSAVSKKPHAARIQTTGGPKSVAPRRPSNPKQPQQALSQVVKFASPVNLNVTLAATSSAAAAAAAPPAAMQQASLTNNLNFPAAFNPFFNDPLAALTSGQASGNQPQRSALASSLAAIHQSQGAGPTIPIQAAAGSMMASNIQPSATQTTVARSAASMAYSRILSNYLAKPLRRQGNYKRGGSQPSISGTERQLQTQPASAERDGMTKSQKGRKRLEKLIEQEGGEMTFSRLKTAYERQFQVPLNTAEICRLFGAAEEELKDHYEFFKTRLNNDVRVNRLPNGDLLLVLIDDEDDLDDFENLSIVDTHARKLPLLREVHPPAPINEDPNRSQYPNRVAQPPAASSLKIHETPNGSYFRDIVPLPPPPSNHSVVAADDRQPFYWKGTALATAIRTQDDYLPYKVLGDKVLSFVRSKGSLKLRDLSTIFYEEDGRCIDPRNYPEGSWEDIMLKILSAGGHPELVIQDGMVDLRDRAQKLTAGPKVLPNKLTNGPSDADRSKSSSSTEDGTVPAMIYDLLEEAGRPLPQKEILEKLKARDVAVNACQLMIKLITKYANVFRCEFGLAGALISLEHGAKRPEEQSTAVSRLELPGKSIRINTHIMSKYRSVDEPADGLFKPVLLINIELVDEPPNRLRIQAAFRLRCFERAYNLFEEKMYHYYRQYEANANYAVQKPEEEANYVYYDAAKGRAFRVQCIGERDDTAGTVPAFLIDQLRQEEVPINQLRKLTDEFAKPAYGVIAQTAPFTITAGREDEFHARFSEIRSLLLQNTQEDIQANINSEPSQDLFELKQLYTEAYGDLKVPAKFVRENLITMFTPSTSRNESHNSLSSILNSIARGPPGIVQDPSPKNEPIN